MLSRRALLALGLATGASLATRRASAIGPSSKLQIGQLKLPDGAWNPRPAALRRLAWEIDKRTSIDVELEAQVVTLADKRLHETPFLYLAGDREFAVPPEAHLERLRRFLTFGGFLLIDSAEGRTDGAFDHSARKLVTALFPPPSDGLQIVPRDHVVNKSFYLLDRPVGRLAIAPAMEGVLHDDRLVIAYVGNDLGGAWQRDNFGNYEYPCDPGGEPQREMSFRVGVNLVMYAFCLDYKTDQVHVPFIMKRRRWRPDDNTAPTPAPATPDRGRGR